MRTIKDLANTTTIFHSTIWADVVEEIREVIDVEDNNVFVTNIVDDILVSDFGDYELHPELVTSENYMDESAVYDTTALAKRVDTCIGQNKEYWLRFVQSIKAEFNPLYNVDAEEITTSEYGEQEVKNTIGERANHNTYGQKEIDYKHAQQTVDFTPAEKQVETTDDAYNVSHAIGARTTTHDETTMDDVANYKHKDKDTVTVTANGSGYGDIDHIDQKKVTEVTKAINNTKDTTVAQTYTDTDTHKTYTDNLTQDETTDTRHSDEYTDTVTVERHGNIGVTKSTELLTDNIEFGKILRLATIIANEISKKISLAAIWY